MNLGRGTLVDNRYRVVELVGEGSSAQVYLAEAVRDGGGRVALKILRRPGDETLSNELAILQKLEHPSLVRLLGHGTLSREGPPYLALEWVDGTDLVEASRLLPPSRLRGLLAQLCRGLAYLHGQGIVHGDLKPSNLRVLRSPDGAGDGLVIKILDFGLARLIDGPDRPEGGTLAYAAPEMLRGGNVDGRADLYALGILLYRILSGSLPFDVSDPAAALRGHLEETPRPLDRDRVGASAELAGIVTRLLMKDPADRFASAAELADRLEEDEEAAAGDTSASPSSAGLRPPVMVGRERETQALLEFLDGHPRGKDGHGLALILGEGGIGKSRLLAEVGDRARERGLGVHQGSCHETGAEPFGAFLELFRWAVDLAESRGLRTGKDGEEGEEIGLIERCGPEVVKVVPRAFRTPVQPSAELQPRYERLRLIDTVGTFLLAVSRTEPFLLAIEDLHWTDDASADLLEYLLRNRARGRLALAATARPAENRVLWLKDTLQREGGEGSVLRIVLERLDEEAVAELARSALALPAPSPALAAHLLRETAGNPFFVMEMLRDLVEEGLLTHRNGTWRWDEERLRRRPRPAGIAQALERRIARTGDRERHVLQALALLDRAVDPELLATVAAAAGGGQSAGGTSLAAVNGGAGTAAGGLTAAARGDRTDVASLPAATRGDGTDAASLAAVTRGDGTDAASLPAVTRGDGTDAASLPAVTRGDGADAASLPAVTRGDGTDAASLPAVTRGDGTDAASLPAAAEGGSAATTTAGNGAAEGGPVEVEVAACGNRRQDAGSGGRLEPRSTLEEVLEALTDRGLVVRYGEAPGERFAIAHDAARELVERAVGSVERQRIHRTAGTALEERYGSDGEEQIERMAYHFIQAGDDDRSARYCVRAAAKARRLYANEEACYFYLQALKYYTADDDPVRWDALGSLGEVYLLQAKVRHAIARYRELQKLSEGAASPPWLVRAHLGIAESSRKLADYSTQMEHARIALRIAIRADDNLGKADCLQVLGLGHFNLGRIHTAIKCYRTSLSLLERSDDGRLRRCVLNRLGLALLSLGDFQNAARMFEDALNMATKNDRSGMLNNLGCVAEALGEYRLALTRYDECGAIANEVGNRYYITLARLNRAGLLIRIGASSRAENDVHAALRMSIELGDRLLQGYLTVFQGQLRLAKHEIDDAESYFVEAKKLAATIRHVEVRLLADLGIARVLSARGDSLNALSVTERVMADALASSVKETAAYAAVYAAHQLHRQSSNNEALKRLEVAWRLLAETPYADVEWRAHLCTGRIREALEQTEAASESFRAGGAVVDYLAAQLDEQNREIFLADPERLELRVKASRATAHQSSSGHFLRAERLEVLRRVSESLLVSHTPAQIADTLARETTSFVGALFSRVFLRSSCGTFHIAAQAGEAAESTKETESGALLASWLDGRSCAGRTHAIEETQLGNSDGFLLCIPGLENHEGAIFLQSDNIITCEDRRILEILARQTAVLLSRIPRTECTSQGCPTGNTRGVVRFGKLSSISPIMQRTLGELRDSALSSSGVLLEGESGVGKELAAQAIHASSTFARGPFVPVDCGALPEGIAEAELFGCIRGAFSGADRERTGLLEAAHGGTLFLDEIGNLSLPIQTKLLRALQSGEVRPVGSTHPKTVRIRVIAATNSDLRRAMLAGRFRKDLYYRIAAFHVKIPALRDRIEDLGTLVEELLKEIADQSAAPVASLTPAAIAVLRRFHWPGNVRQLRNVLAAANARTVHREIGVAELSVKCATQSGNGQTGDLEVAMSLLRAALRETGGDKSAAARLLGWSRMRVYRTLKRAAQADSVGELGYS